MIHLKRNQHQWIADTNPADEGEDSWIYKIWYEERVNRVNDPTFNANDYGLIEVFIHDNPFLTEEDITDLKARCSYDPTLLDRYFKGLWTKGGLSQRLFATTFSEKIHVIGGVDYETGEEEVIWPDPEHSEFIVGLDPGYMNNAIIFVEKRVSASGKPIFSVFDEYVRLNYELSIDEFASELISRLERWENLLNAKIEWKFYIDPSSATTTRMSLNSMAIAEASNGRINFIPAPREGIESSVNFIKSLLKSNRLYISANCKNVIEMFKEIRASNKLGEMVKRENNPYKHTLDALRYAICSDSIVFGPNTRRLTAEENTTIDKVIAF
jgi:PBSX family phage terminase large subunit